MPIPTRDLVLLAEVTKPHGIRGEVCVKSHAAAPDVFARLRTVFLARPGEASRPARIAGLRPHKAGLLLRFAGVEDRNRAEELRGCAVLARTADLPALAEDEVYLHQVAGLAAHLPDGSRLGVVAAADDSAGQELWLIRTDDGREALLPAAFVTGLDLAAGKAFVDPPPGLLDLYLGS